MSIDSVRIPLRARDGSVRAYTVVDSADADWVSQFRWYLDRGYALRHALADGRSYPLSLQRALLGMARGDKGEVDHINRDRLDNRRSNLRVLTPAGNRQNTSSACGSSSQYRGVYWDKELGKWRAALKVGGKRIHLGRFTDEDEAGQVARDAITRLMPYSAECIEAAG